MTGVQTCALPIYIKTYSTVAFPKQTTFWEALKDSDIMKMKQELHLLQDPQMQLERALQEIPATGEWQYLLPYNLE